LLAATVRACVDAIQRGLHLSETGRELVEQAEVHA
jgi:hypothetical protein